MPKSRYDYEEQHKKDLERIRELEGEIKSLNFELSLLREGAREIQKLKNEYQQRLSEEYWKPTANERGAGRKPKLTELVKKRIEQLRGEGKTQREIAEQLSISIGLVNKGCNQ